MQLSKYKYSVIILCNAKSTHNICVVLSSRENYAKAVLPLYILLSEFCLLNKIFLLHISL